MSAPDIAANYLEALDRVENAWGQKQQAAERVLSLGVVPTARLLVRGAMGAYYALRLDREAFGATGLDPALRGELLDNSRRGVARAILEIAEQDLDLMAELDTGA